VEAEHLVHRRDRRGDELQPAFGLRGVRDLEKEERLMILVESRQDVALDIADIEHFFGRRAGEWRTDLPRKGRRSRMEWKALDDASRLFSAVFCHEVAEPRRMARRRRAMP